MDYISFSIITLFPLLLFALVIILARKFFKKGLNKGCMIFTIIAITIISIDIGMTKSVWDYDSQLVKTDILSSFTEYTQNDKKLNNDFYKQTIEDIVSKNEKLKLNKISVDNVNKDLDIVNIDISKEKVFSLRDDFKFSISINKNNKDTAIKIKE